MEDSPLSSLVSFSLFPIFLSGVGIGVSVLGLGWGFGVFPFCLRRLRSSVFGLRTSAHFRFGPLGVV